MLPETQTYIERLRALRGETLKAMEGASTPALNWKPTRQNTNSLFVLATHLLGSEQRWIQRVVGGRAIERDRDAEFRARGKDAAHFRARFADAARTSEEVLSRLSEAELSAIRETPNYGAVSVRWCIVHLIEHFSEHVGHMQLTRQMWGEKARSKKPKAKSMKRKT